MFRSIIRKIGPNPLDHLLKKAQKKRKNKFLLAWNRGMGDVPLGLYAVIKRIRDFIPDASITFLVREDLYEAFQLLENIEILRAPLWIRGQSYHVEKTLQEMQISPAIFDIIIEWPDPTWWVPWQRGQLCPRLSWKNAYDPLHEEFSLPKGDMIIAVQPFAEASKGLHRNWPYDKWNELFTYLQKRLNISIVLFGTDRRKFFDQSCIVDLRGKTSILQMLSIIKNRCTHLLVPDSGILSLVYYLDVPFSIQVISLWSDPYQGVLKQKVSSPNHLLSHTPIIAQEGDMNRISVKQVIMHLFPQNEL